MTVVRNIQTLSKNPSSGEIWKSICEWQENLCGENPGMLRWLQANKDSPLTTTIRHGGTTLELVAVDGRLAVRIETPQSIASIVVAPSASKGMELAFELETNSAEQADRVRLESVHSSFFRHIEAYLDEHNRQDVPVDLEKMNLDTLAAVIKCEKCLHRPLVYISKDDGNEHNINPDNIARRLQYLAVVVRESGFPRISELKSRTDRCKPFNGYVGVYWRKKSKVFFPWDEDRLVQDIMAWTTLAPLPRHLSWTDIRNRWFQQQLQCQRQEHTASQQEVALYQERIQELERELEKKERELDEFIENFTNPDTTLQEENIRLRQEVARLRRGQPASLDDGSHDCLSIRLDSAENDLHPGEISDFIGGIIWDYLKKHRNTTDGSRHTHVVKSLYDNNPLLNFEETESYKLYRQIESQIRQEELDLPLYQLKHSKRGSHLKYVFCSDDRYILTVAKTGSDKRGIDNAISDAGKHFLEPRK